MYGNFKNLLRLLFIRHKIIYFLHNSEFQVNVQCALPAGWLAGRILVCTPFL